MIMTNEKIKKLSSKIDKLLPSKDLSPQDVYIYLLDLMRKQRDYFLHVKEIDIIKLTIYLYSLHKTGKYELGDKILNNIFFAVLVNPTDEFYSKECSECGGNGQFRCSYCNGVGEIYCPYCNGDGEIDCRYCNGDGVDGAGDTCTECEGGGKVECPYCNGSGEQICSHCDGDGEQVCSGCNGSGEIETEDRYYTIYNICSWNKTLYHSCELNVETLVPVYTDETIDKYRDDMINLYESSEATNDDRFNEDVSVENFYCTEYYEEPTLFRYNTTMQISIYGTPNINHLLV